jgi:hypothetical protein
MNLSIAVTVDIDNDGVSLVDERNRLSWRTLELVPTIADMVHAHGLPVTWFVRADTQLRNLYGHASYLLDRHDALWRKLKDQGDEIGWHPHLYSAGGDGSYRPERHDNRLVHQLRATHAELRAQGHEFASARMGEAVGSNAIMHTLAELGLRADSSAIPGRRRNDESRNFDWSPSPNAPYRPSVADYRVPGVPALPILEVPMTVFPVQAPYDPTPLRRYANLAYRPAIFADAMKRWFESDISQAADAVLILILHPDELIPGPRDHPLYALTPDALPQNVDALLKATRQRGFNFAGCTISGLMHYAARERRFERQ